jgi:DNA polymerase-3 subunit beta
MKFIVPSNLLLSQLSQVSGVIVSKPVLPILENFLFDISKGELTISATDLETSMITKLPVEAKEDIKVAIPSRLTMDILRQLADQPLTFTVNEENFSVEMSTSSGRYKLAGQDAADFPQMPEVQSENSFEVTSRILSRAINKTIFATGTDELRPNLLGVNVELGPNGTNFVATDANRLVKYTRSNITTEEESSFIIPKKALNLLKSTLGSDDSIVRVDYGTTNVFFSFGEIKLICRLIDERYPDYKNVIPSDNNNELTLNRLDLLNSVKRIAIFSNRATHQIRLKVAGSELNISAEDLELSNEAQERLDCEYTGADMEIGFNSRYLLDLLSFMDGDNVKFLLDTPSKAGLLVPTENEKDEEILMLIMPMMLSN